MSKKALKEGYLSQIANVLLRPLTPYKPENQMLDEFHEILFDVENVKIINFKSTQKFKLPGLYKLTTYKRVPSMGDRNVKPNSLLTVRLDSTQAYISYIAQAA